MMFIYSAIGFYVLMHIAHIIMSRYEKNRLKLRFSGYFFRKFFRPFGYESHTFSIEMTSNSCHAIGVGIKFPECDSDIMFSFHFFGAIYIGYEQENYKKKFIPKKLKEREYGFTISKGDRDFIGALNIDFGALTEEGEPQSALYVNLFDLMSGKAIYLQSKPETGIGMIRMPEKMYKVEWKRYTAYWVYPRWFTRKVERIEIEVEKGGVPVPGKGTCSYNCGDTAIQSTTKLFKKGWTIDYALQSFTRSILETRKRYGGSGWVPKEK